VMFARVFGIACLAGDPSRLLSAPYRRSEFPCHRFGADPAAADDSLPDVDT
jgi:hypothetical protein